MEPHHGVSVCVCAIGIFEACIHSKNEALGARLFNRWTWRVPDHSFASGTDLKLDKRT
jgi:hypothetical protein